MCRCSWPQHEKGRVFIKTALFICAMPMNVVPRLAAIVRQIVWHAAHDFAVLVMPLFFFLVLDTKQVQA